MDELNFNELEKNPLNDLINKETYDLLMNKGLFNETSVRDWLIRKKFKSLRTKKIKVSDAIDLLRESYPYLQFETLRKIVHHPPKVKNVN